MVSASAFWKTALDHKEMDRELHFVSAKFKI